MISQITVSRNTILNNNSVYTEKKWYFIGNIVFIIYISKSINQYIWCEIMFYNTFDVLKKIFENIITENTAHG